MYNCNTGYSERSVKKRRMILTDIIIIITIISKQDFGVM